jgi:hypothetical protein
VTLDRIEEFLRAVDDARAASTAKHVKDNQILDAFFETLHEFRKELFTHVDDTAILIDARDTARAERDRAEKDALTFAAGICQGVYDTAQSHQDGSNNKAYKVAGEKAAADQCRRLILLKRDGR